jgi:peptide/nickel transport system substrate-binding protein
VKLLTLLLSLMCIAQVARAAGPEADPTATLTYFDAATNATLDPVEPQSNSSVSQAALMAIYDALVKFSDAGEPLPGLAKSWSYNDDLTEFTLTLRAGVTFHDGNKLDAAAVVRNLQRSIELGARAGASTQEITSRIAGLSAKGDDSVVIKLKAPNGQLPYLLAMQPGMMISPASLTEGAFGGTLKPIGAGPYRVRQFEAAVRTTMDRFDGYWDNETGRPASLVQQYVPDGRARLNAVRSGQATLVLLDTRQIDEAKAAGLTVQVNERNTISDLYINVSRDTTGKLKVRQALMHAIDRDALAEALGGGVARPTAQLFSPISRMYDPALDKLFPYDPAKARQMLTEAGFPNGVDINWLMSNTSETRLVAEAMQAMVAESGFRMKFDVVDISQYVLFRRPPTRGDIYLGRWGGRADPLQVFQEVASSDGSVNAGGAASPEIDALIAKARAMRLDDPAREAIMHQLARLTTELVSHVALMTRPNIYAFRKGCILNLTSYLPTGSDRFNDVQVGKACK